MAPLCKCTKQHANFVLSPRSAAYGLAVFFQLPPPPWLRSDIPITRPSVQSTPLSLGGHAQRITPSVSQSRATATQPVLPGWPWWSCPGCLDVRGGGPQHCAQLCVHGNSNYGNRSGPRAFHWNSKRKIVFEILQVSCVKTAPPPDIFFLQAAGRGLPGSSRIGLLATVPALVFLAQQNHQNPRQDKTPDKTPVAPPVIQKPAFAQTV